MAPSPTSAGVTRDARGGGGDGGGGIGKKTLVFDSSQYCKRTAELQALVEAFDRLQPNPQALRSQDQLPQQPQQRHDDQNDHAAIDSAGGERQQQHETKAPSSQGEADAKTQIAFISGFSGCGKSTVVNEFHETLLKRTKKKAAGCDSSRRGQSYYFVSSKFDEFTQQDPYSVIFDGLNKLCAQVLQHRPPSQRRRQLLEEKPVNSSRAADHEDDEEKSEVERVRDAIPESVKMELQILTLAVPNLALLLNETTEDDGPSTATDTPTTTSTAPTATATATTGSVSVLASKVKYLYVKFLQCVCSSSTTLVLHMDDLQWANESCLELLKVLLTDAKISGFMFIGCYRSEILIEEDFYDCYRKSAEELDTDGGNPLGSTTSSLQASLLHGLFDRLKEYERPYTEIEVKNLTVDEIFQFVTRVLDATGTKDAADIRLLAETLFTKTQGNAYFITTYLQLLVERSIMTFDMIQYKWTWDKERLQAEVDLADNVVSVVLRKLRLLHDKSLQDVLIFASFLPSTFDANVLQKVLHRCGKPTSNLELHLETLVAKGLLSNMLGSQIYSFAHDRVQQASMALLGDDEKERRRVNRIVGESLVSLFCDQEFNAYTESSALCTAPTTTTTSSVWMIFAALDRLESCGYEDYDKMIQYYTIAGTKSSALGAYGPAALYFGKAISILRSLDRDQGLSSSQSIWCSRYDQCMTLYLLGTEMEINIGHYETANDFCNDILTNAKRETDKFDSYWLLAEALNRQKRPGDAIHYLKKILIPLGEFPPHVHNPFYLIVRIYRTKSKLKPMEIDDVLSLPVMKQPDKLLAMRALSSLVITTGFSGKIYLALQASIHMITLTFRHGLAPESAYAFTGFAMINYKVFGDDAVALKCKSIATKLFRKIRGSSFFVPMAALSDFDMWFQPLFEVPNMFDNLFEQAMSSGDPVAGIFDFACHICTTFWCGYPLSIPTENSTILLNMIRQYQLDSAYAMVSPFDGLLRCLKGDIDPLAWISSFDVPNKRTWDKNRIIEVVQGCLSRALAAFYFRSNEEAERYLKGFRHFGDLRSAFFEIVADVFCGPIIMMGRYRETKHRRYKQKAVKEYKILAKMVKERPINLLHKFYLVEAEFAATFPDLWKKRIRQDDDGMDVRSKFDKAISTSRKLGYIQDAAFGCELSGEYFVRSGDEFWAKHYLSLAVRLYGEWGSKGKVRHLRSTYGSTYLVEFFEKGGGDDIHEMKSIRKPLYEHASLAEKTFNPKVQNSSVTSASAISLIE